MRPAAALIIILTACALSAHARIIYVDDDAAGLDDGSCWADAFNYLQDALATAQQLPKPVEVRVAQGVYRPDRSSANPGGTGDRLATFPLLDNVAMRGGFAGVAAPDPNVRDVVLYETILSGDLAGDDIPVLDPRDLHTEPTRADNARTLITGGRCSRSAVVDGLTISSCANPTLIRTTPGAVSLSDRDGPCCPSIRNCTFVGTDGAAIYIDEAEPEIANCTFLRNRGTGGGAVTINTSLYVTSPLVIKDSTFAENYAASGGGAISGDRFTIERCTFVRNSAEAGGAIYCSMTATMINCLFIHNTAEEAGGAIYFGRPGITVTSCTFSNNVAPAGNALACLLPYFETIPPPFATIANTILWDEGDEIHVTEHAEVNVTYSNIRGGWPGEGNIDVDPCFVELGRWDPNGTPDDPQDDFWVEGDYHLKSQTGRWDPNSESWVIDDVTSPCIDAGDPNSPIGYEPFPNGGVVNMGAYGGTPEASKSYFGEPVCQTPIAGDINGDCRVDFKDLGILLNHWLHSGAKGGQ